eukprot:6176970-Pleurochrysis_carterae.AAC.1
MVIRLHQKANRMPLRPSFTAELDAKQVSSSRVKRVLRAHSQLRRLAVAREREGHGGECGEPAARAETRARAHAACTRVRRPITPRAEDDGAALRRDKKGARAQPHSPLHAPPRARGHAQRHAQLFLADPGVNRWLFNPNGRSPKGGLRIRAGAGTSGAHACRAYSTSARSSNGLVATQRVELELESARDECELLKAQVDCSPFLYYASTLCPPATNDDNRTYSSACVEGLERRLEGVTATKEELATVVAAMQEYLARGRREERAANRSE